MYRLLIFGVLLWQCVCIFSFAVPEQESVDLNKYLSHIKDRNKDVSLKIIGGEEVPPHSYPFQAVIFIIRNSSVDLCGGSLISANRILTAAHCIDGPPDYVVVGLGLHNLTAEEPEGVGIKASDYIIHTNWSIATLQNDIALVKLPQNVTFNQYIQPTTFASGNNKYEGDNATLIGWGETETGSASSVLKRTNATVMSNTDCANTDYVYEVLIKPSHICTSGVGPVGTCFGDSGGPLIVDGVQVGITSFGTANCTLGLLSVYTRVSEFADWIEEHI